jgi:copper transport protein
VLRLVPRPKADARLRVAVVSGGSDDGSFARDADQAHGSDARELRSLRRSTWVEVAAGAAVLAVTALLVNAAPARSATAVAAGANGGEIRVTMKSPKVWVEVSLTPGRPGRNDVHVSALRPNGAPEELQGLRLSFDQPSRRIAPITVPISAISTGHYLATGFAVPLSGTWRVTAYPLFSQFDEVTVTGSLKL